MNPDTIHQLARQADDLASALRQLASDATRERPPAPPPPPAAPPPPPPAPSYAQRPPPRGEETLAPFGRAKGSPLSTLEDKDLQWLAAALEKSIGDPSKGMYRRKNETDLAAVRAELRARFL